MVRLEQLADESLLLAHIGQYSETAQTIVELKEMAMSLGRLRVAVSILEGSEGLQDLLQDVVSAGFVVLLLESMGVVETIDGLIRYTNQMANLQANLQVALDDAVAESNEENVHTLTATIRGTRRVLLPTAEAVAVAANWLNRFMAEWRHINSKLSICTAFSQGLKAKACWVLEACSEPLQELASRHLEERVISLREQLQGDLDTLATLAAELE